MSSSTIDIPRRSLATEERRTERRHAGDHRHRRVSRQVVVVGRHPLDVHALGADPTEDGERPSMSAMPASASSSSLSASAAHSVMTRPRCSTKRSYSAPDELRGRSPPRSSLRGRSTATSSLKSSTNSVKGTTSASRNSGGLRAEVAEEQVLGDAGRLGDLAGRRAAVVLTGEQLAGRVEQQPAGLAPGPAGRLRGGCRACHGSSPIRRRAVIKIVDPPS